MRLAKLLAIIIFFIIFCFNSLIYSKCLISLDNTSITIDIQRDIEGKLSNYIKSGIPFEVKLKIYLKQSSKFFFLKDKTVKIFNEELKFSFDIIKKKYIIVYKNNYFSTTNYNNFIKKISKFEIVNFIPYKIIEKNNDYYITLNISYIPLKGSFSIKNIYIFPKIKEFSFEKKFKLGELIGEN